MPAHHRSHRLPTLLLAALIGAGPAFAGPPPWAGGGHGGGGDGPHGYRDGDRDGGKGRHGKDRHEGRRDVRPGAYFVAQDRDSVRRYYASHCPPGLAKKHNGCQPPGHAKRVWVVGQPLPPTVVVAPVPAQILVTLPPVPVNHRYVQVAGDILLVAAGTMMVVDGINGLSR